MKIENLPPTIESTALVPLSQLSDLAIDYAKLAKSANTRKAYKSDWADFQFWCRLRQLNPLPAEPSTIAFYLSDRATNQWSNANGKQNPPLKAATLQRRLTTIYQAHLVAGYSIDSRHPMIRETWQGILNTIGTAQTQVKPITIEVLRSMLNSIPSDSPLHVRDRAILLLGFSGAFRRSELAALRYDDLSDQREGYIVKLTKSKTDQTSSGRDIGIPYGSNPMTRPVRALKDWINLANIEQGPLFRSIDRHGNIGSTPLSCQSVALIIKRTVGTISDSKNFSGHSLRAGFATSAARAGISDYQIMRQTGHRKSDTLKKYIRIGNLWEDNAATKIGL